MATTMNLTSGARVIRKSANGRRPIPGTVIEAWTDRRNRPHVRVRWDQMLGGGSRWGTGSTTVHSDILASSVLVATDALIAERTAAWEAAIEERDARRNAARAGTAYPPMFAVFDVTRDEPMKTRSAHAYDRAALARALAQHEQQWPERAFAILRFQLVFDGNGEKTSIRFVDDEAAA